jgi:predicted double-glycine peptidase
MCSPDHGMKIDRKRLTGRIGMWIVLLVSSGILCAAVLRHIPGMHRQIAVMLSGAEYLGTDGVIFQKQKNDCGAAALAMVLADAGQQIRREEILPHIVMTEKGTSMEELRRFAVSRGVILEGWRLSIDELSRRRFPALLYVKQDHFITADSISTGTVFLRDPALGRMKMPKERFQKIWNGYALVMKEQ